MESTVLPSNSFAFPRNSSLASNNNSYHRRIRPNLPNPSTRCTNRFPHLRCSIRFQKPRPPKFLPHLSALLLPFRLCLDESNLLPSLGLGSFAITALLCFSLAVAEAHNSAPRLPLMYPCEDVARYYSDINQLEGSELMRHLYSIISAHRSLPYKKVWDALKILDAADVDKPEASSRVIEIYSLRVVSKQLAGKPEGWNREHLWPRSYGLTDMPSLTDLHNIRPADINVNSSRGNKFYGECVSESSDCLRPAYREAAPDTETDRERWAPPLKVRGDIARSLMYMAICYGYHEPGGSPNLQLSDSPSIENSTMGLLSELLRWNELDPPSREEKLRNDKICSIYQHNRNPFIDHPEYANRIWKHISSSSGMRYKPSLKAWWINEFHYNNKGKDQNEFVEIVSEPSIDAAGLRLMLYDGADGKVYKSLALNDNQIFSVTKSDSGFLIYTAFVPLQNGPGDGMALVSAKNGDQLEVLQFLSYAGTVKASDGPVKGIQSEDINIQETEASSKYDSVGQTGRRIGEFKWRKFEGGATPGKPNIGQRL